MAILIIEMKPAAKVTKLFWPNVAVMLGENDRAHDTLATTLTISKI